MDHADLMMHLKGPEAALAKLREGELVHKLTPRYKYRMASYLLRCGRQQQALLELEEALMADHARTPSCWSITPRRPPCPR
jgi:hypothetical protein